MKVVYGMFSQETNSFSPFAGELDQFSHLPNAAIVRVIGDVITEKGLEPVPSIFLRSMSAGKLTDDTFKHALDGFVNAVKESSPEGVFINLHGATQSDSEDDVAGAILEKVREAAGKDAVIGTSLDFHANVTEKMMKNADIITGYRTYPHIDQEETSRRMAELCADKLLGRKTPYMRMIKLPMFHQAEACLTTEGPMKALMEKADPAKFEGVYDITVFQVQPWLNAPEAGASVIVIADSQEHADAAADKLAKEYWSIRKDIFYKLYDLDEVIDIALTRPGKPVMVSDSADSPPAGAPGDSAAVLERILERGLEKKLVAYIAVNAPEATAKAFEVGVGATAEFTIGGSFEKKLIKPVKVTAYVKTLNDGDVQIRYDENSSCIPQAKRRIAVLKVGNVSVVVCDHQPRSVVDITYKAVGLDPEVADLIVTKSAIGYRVYYKKYTDLMYTVDTPGSSSSNLLQFDFDKINRPCYPFDEIEEYKPISYITGYQK